MTYNFEEPEFPEAPKLVQFGLTAKDYEDLAEVDKAIKSASWFIPAPVDITWVPMIRTIPVLPLTLPPIFVNAKALGNYFWPFCFACGVMMVVLGLICYKWESKYQSQREHRFAERMAVWRRRVRARAPSQVQYRDTLQPLIEIFETAHAN
ncbi:MAG: hypothetical protein J0L72_10290 [Armatimonadetes bacterium]|nr:hypothetical protein [Armatimonadota bacterium]